ncbi:MAG: MMPL family transporter [Hydrogenophaga sp.]|uniref:MMPL family transporter n=1 Tax=Hydrogenophaga sp. TaxID=1904254 RepID=UPI00276DEF31|nr:MMPL family transporter [Hydrogenophaga sp.]MDP2418842.1 MMPL family transporter [Hydrogenophaga sp.]MDZ4190082.1 MMPL family transporter [Hydrogenophaga sp.]
MSAASTLDRSLLAAVRLGVRHPRAVLGTWLLLAVLCAWVVVRGAGAAFGTDIERSDGSESVRANAMLRAHLPSASEPDRPNEVLVLHAPALTVDDPAYAAAANAIAERLQALGTDVVAGGRSYFLDGDASLVSADRHTTLVPLILVDPQRNARVLRDAVREATPADSPLTVTPVGPASVGLAYQELANSDLRAELRIGLPAAVLVLLWVFGSVVAAALPLLVAAVSIAVALALAVLVAQFTPVYFLVVNMVLMMGLAVGIDYALFMLVRYREERRAGASVEAAVERSGARAGHAVLFSGATVVVALLGLLLVPTNIFRGLAAGAMAAVLVAVLASLTLLPALLRLLGDRVDALRLPLPRGFGGGGNGDNSDHGGAGIAGRAATAAVRRPWLALVVSVSLLGLLAAPALHMRIGFAGIETLPPQLDTRQAFDRLQAHFRIGLVAEAVVVVHTEPGAEPTAQAAAVDAALLRLRGALATDNGFLVELTRERRSPDGRLVVLNVPLPGESEGEAALQAITRLRTALVPQAFADVPAEALVTGTSAGYLDFFSLTRQFAPLVVALVLGLSFVLLAWAFRSIVVPLKAAALNLLSVGAAYGALVLVFQFGVGASWLGLQQVPIIEAWIPLFLFTVLYGLSMDYHVFLLTRVREHYDRSGDNASAVVQAIGSTAGVITGAAMIMVAVFAGFAAGELVMFQQIGFGLAVAVLLDATLVRLLLVPALMTVLGDKNWYAPRWLGGEPQKVRDRAP